MAESIELIPIQPSQVVNSHSLNGPKPTTAKTGTALPSASPQHCTYVLALAQFSKTINYSSVMGQEWEAMAVADFVALASSADFLGNARIRSTAMMRCRECWSRAMRMGMRRFSTGGWKRVEVCGAGAGYSMEGA
ncbi:unnamed protein product [Penicillium viridicatum]